MDAISALKSHPLVSPVLNSFSASGLDTQIYLVLAALAGILLRYGWLAGKKQTAQLPPGPKPKFLIGNLMDIPSTNAAETYIEWGKKYNSDILHASAFGTHIVVLNKLEDAEALLEKRAAKYSNRVPMPIIKLMGWEGNMAFIETAGPEWRKHRRLAQQHFHLDASAMNENVQRVRIHSALRAIMDSPEDFLDHIKTMAISIPLTSMYGRTIKSLDDPYILKAYRSMALGSKLLMPGYTMINIFPVLGRIPAWLPGATAQKMVKEAKELSDWLTMSPLEEIKKEMASRRISSQDDANIGAMLSIGGGHYRTVHFLGIPGEGTQWRSGRKRRARTAQVASAVYGGAVDTMIATTTTLFYLLATHPRVQKLVQAEIDRVVGRDRLPTLADRASMPFSEAVYRELIRWGPVGRVGVPHCTTDDDIYKGYFIPKGTVVISNILAMSHDEDVYPAPSLFKPERFLDADGQLNNKHRSVAYGFGNRICPGRYFAGSTIWLMLVTLMSCFDIEKAKDENGQDIEINHEFIDTALATHKKPFKCAFIPRSPASGALLDEALISA